MNAMDLKALAKVNLGLDVTGVRENGYHDVRMVMQTVYLFDEVHLEILDTPEVILTTNLGFLPTDEKNLAYRAAKMLLEEAGSKQGVKIHLDKHIPVAAGLAGGSSDAAAVLFGVNKLLQLGLSIEELMERGVKLGADVPYCILRGTALAEGIGEVLTPLPGIPPCTVVLAKPPVSVSTKMVYEELDAKEITTHPDIDGIIDAIKAGDLKTMADRMGNVLEEVTIPHYPVISELKQMMLEEGALNAMMSGSGPTVFGIFESREQAKKAAARIRESGLTKQVFEAGAHIRMK